jgi:biotin carboxyl carrier protein
MDSAHAAAAEAHAVVDESWRAFLAAQTESQFFAAWLRLLCEPVPSLATGVVLLRSERENTFVPIALWPEAPRDLTHLGSITGEALRLNAGVLQPVQPADRGGQGGYQAALPLEASSRTVGVAVFEMAVRSQSEAQQLLRHVHWGLGWTLEYLARKRATSDDRAATRLGAVMEVLAGALRPLPLEQLLMELANQLCRRLEASRVVIGLRDRRRLRLAAISDVAYFENRSDAGSYYLAAIEEATEAYAAVRYDAAGASADVDEHPAHAHLAAYSRATSILTVSLHSGGGSLGAVCAERLSGSAFSDDDVDWLNALASLLPAVIEQKRRADQSLVAHAARGVKTLGTRLLGPGHLTWKCSAIVAIAATAALVLVPVDYRVTAHTVIEGEVERAAVAPFDGYLQASAVRAGDVVHRGELLCQLNDRDLRLEREKWANEREQYSRELRQAMANQDLSHLEVIEAELNQSQAHLALVEDELGRASVTAPFDGVVISGDLTQRIGSPVQRGQKLFEIAPLNSYRVILQVDERDVRAVAVGQSGRLLVTSLAGRPIPFHVSMITPVATSKDGRDYFRVEARLDSAPPALRPGMEGVGKIVIGPQPLYWVLSHRFVEWLRLLLWRWLP